MRIDLVLYIELNTIMYNVISNFNVLKTGLEQVQIYTLIRFSHHIIKVLP